MASTSNAITETSMSPIAQALYDKVAPKVIGQSAAVSEMMDVYELYRAGMAAAGRPVGIYLFFGYYGHGQDVYLRDDG